MIQQEMKLKNQEKNPYSLTPGVTLNPLGYRSQEINLTIVLIKGKLKKFGRVKLDFE